MSVVRKNELAASEIGRRDRDAESCADTPPHPRAAFSFKKNLVVFRQSFKTGENSVPLRSLKLFSLNIQGDNHLKRVERLIRRERPDVACLQEVPAKHLYELSRRTGMSYSYAVMGRTPQHGKIGIATLWDPSITHDGHLSYSYGGRLTEYWEPHDPSSYSRVLLVLEFNKGGARFNIAQTHFIWTPNGEASDAQRTEVDKLFGVMEKAGNAESGIILVGDMNAPRGREIFERIAARYTDHIPASVKTTLDKKFHRAGELKLVVDVLFSTPHYAVQDVRVVSGVSDHCAIIGSVSRAEPSH